ncbi:MAG: haloacid dehalogenase-like hydrolase [Thermoplasmata archaeon]|nr:haloacid dehalogenase-like hydrolase [Thermoplasmata archaeon]
MAGWPYRLVTTDLDGTLTAGHGWGFLAERLGRRRQFEDTQREFMAGRIGEDEHLRNLLAIAEGASRREVLRILAETPRVAGIPEGIRRIHERGAHVALLTHNPAYVTGWYERQFGFDAADGIAGSPQFRAGLVGPARAVRADKTAALARLCHKFGVSPREVAHVGDGRADAAIFPLVGLGVAFGARDPLVRKAADLTVDGSDFRRVVDALERHPPTRG